MELRNIFMTELLVGLNHLNKCLYESTVRCTVMNVFFFAGGDPLHYMFFIILLYDFFFKCAL